MARATTRRSGAVRSGGPRRGSGAIRERMYNVGFGDCFLLFIPTDAEDLEVLVDCGTFKTGPHSMGDVVARVIDDVRDTNGRPRIDVVVATHRHKDHIIGFADPRWRDVIVGEVWTPWTESPTGPQAKSLRLSQERFTDAVLARLQRRQTDGLAVAPGLMDIVLNGKANSDALQALHYGFKNSPKRRYLPDRDAGSSVLPTPALPGVTVCVLGPSHLDEVRRAMDPEPGEAYLAAIEAEASGVDGDRVTLAFGWDWAIPDDSNDPAEASLLHQVRLTEADVEAVRRHASHRDWETLAAPRRRSPELYQPLPDVPVWNRLSSIPWGRTMGSVEGNI
jgi:hypothetical protein